MLKLHSQAPDQVVEVDMLTNLTDLRHLELCLVPSSHQRGVQIRSALLRLQPDKHRSLQYLSLTRFPLNDGVLSHISRFSSLHFLTIDTPLNVITEKGLVQLAELNNLRILVFYFLGYGSLTGSHSK